MADPLAEDETTESRSLTRTARILIVSVDPALVRTLTSCLNELEHVVCAVVAGEDVRSATPCPDLAMVDLGLDEEAGAAIEAATQIEHRLEAPVLYVADSMDDPRLQQACAKAPFGYVVKPVDARHLRLGIDAALIAHGREGAIRERAAPPAPAGARRSLGGSRPDAEWAASLSKTIIESASEGIAVVDMDGRFRAVNSVGQSMAEKEDPPVATVDEWLKRHQVFHRDGQTPFAYEELPHIRALRGEAANDVDVVVKSAVVKENAERWGHFRITAKPIRSAAGRPLGALIVVRNTTATVRTEVELRRTVTELHRRMQVGDAIVRSMSDGVVVVDKDLDFTLFNPSAERIMGIGITDTGPSEWSEKYGIFFPDKVSPVPPAELPLVRAVNGEQVEDINLFIRNPRVPRGLYISVNATPVRDDRNRLVGGVAVFRDVSRQVLEKEALTKAFARGRLEITDTILHNIGNAINSVTVGVDTVDARLRNHELLRRLKSLGRLLGEHEGDCASWLATNPQGQKVLPYLVMIVRDLRGYNTELLKTVHRVQSRVSHVVDIIRTQESFTSGTVECKVIDLKSTVDDAIMILQESLSKRSIRIEVDCTQAPDEISIQESKFHQMLVNLIKNSIEAVDELAAIPPNRRMELDPGGEGAEPAEPRIHVVARQEGDSLQVEVKDNGIGIAKKYVDFIFNAGFTTKGSGSGLGLHSIANFVVGVGGRVRAESEGIGCGATVRVTLPLSTAPDGSTNHLRQQSVSLDGPGA